MLRREYFKRPSGFYYFIVRDEKKVSFTYGPFPNLILLNAHSDDHQIMQIYALKKRLVCEAENKLCSVAFLIRWYGRILRVLPFPFLRLELLYSRLCEAKGYCYDRLIRRRQAVRYYRGGDL